MEYIEDPEEFIDEEEYFDEDELDEDFEDDDCEDDECDLAKCAKPKKVSLLTYAFLLKILLILNLGVQKKRMKNS